MPVDGFWSISVYNAKGYFEPNPQNAYTLNNSTNRRSKRGHRRHAEPDWPAVHRELKRHNEVLVVGATPNQSPLRLDFPQPLPA